jgi:hypothetical protein
VFPSCSKITARISKLCYGLDSNHVDAIEVGRSRLLAQVADIVRR